MNEKRMTSSHSGTYADAENRSMHFAHWFFGNLSECIKISQNIYFDMLILSKLISLFTLSPKPRYNKICATVVPSMAMSCEHLGLGVRAKSEMNLF